VGESTRNGAEIVKTVYTIARGTHAEIKSERSRTWALEWLCERL
jgi:hypothetical protein